MVKDLEMVQNSTKKVLVLTDGYCNLCNGLVGFLMKTDTKNALCFIPYQSCFKKMSGNNMLTLQHISTPPNSLIVIENDHVFTRSDAVLRIIHHLPGLWKVLLVFRILPLDFRDFIYNFVAKNRYSWFDKGNECEISCHPSLNQ